MGKPMAERRLANKGGRNAIAPPVAEKAWTSISNCRSSGLRKSEVLGSSLSLWSSPVQAEGTADRGQTNADRTKHKPCLSRVCALYTDTLL